MRHHRSLPAAVQRSFRLFTPTGRSRPARERDRPPNHSRTSRTRRRDRARFRFSVQPAHHPPRARKQCLLRVAPLDATWDEIAHLNPKGVILSGGPNSVYEAGAPQLPAWVVDRGLPVLGICYGMNLLAHALGGEVVSAAHKEYGPATIHVESSESSSSPGCQPTRRLDEPRRPGRRQCRPDVTTMASTGQHAASPPLSNGTSRGIQFHPEVVHTRRARRSSANFLTASAGCDANWSPEFVHRARRPKRSARRSATGGCCWRLSGGVDSSVAAALIHRAIGDQLTPVFVNNGLLRAGRGRDGAGGLRPALRHAAGLCRCEPSGS